MVHVEQREQYSRTDVFTAIAHPIRRQLLDLLLVHDQSVTSLTRSFTITRAAISQHLRVLLDTGLVAERRHGRERHYYLRPKRLYEIEAWLSRYHQLDRQGLDLEEEHLSEADQGQELYPALIPPDTVGTAFDSTRDRYPQRTEPRKGRCKMGLSPEQMTASIINNLVKKTGRSLDEWVELVRTQGPETRKERVQWLKSEHGLGHGQAQAVVSEAEKDATWSPPTGEALITAQYAGRKAHLRPIYDRLVAEVVALGNDVTLDPRKTYVAATRKRQFAVIQPTRQTHVDLGLALQEAEVAGRLEAAQGIGGSARITHRIALKTPEDVDQDVLGWLRAAYERDA